MRTDLERAGMWISSYHLPFAVEDDIAAFDDEERAATVVRIVGSMERAAALGAPVGILHPSTYRGDALKRGIGRFLEQIEKSLATLLARADRLGMNLALENMLPGKEGGRFGSDPEHFVMLRQRCGHARLGFCLDTGHALVAAHENAHLFFEAMGEDIIAFHLADNAGDRDSHLAPGRGLVDWVGVFQNMEAMDFDGVPCIETPPFAFGPNYSVESYRRLIAETETLAISSCACSQDNEF